MTVRVGHSRRRMLPSTKQFRTSSSLSTFSPLALNPTHDSWAATDLSLKSFFWRRRGDADVTTRKVVDEQSPSSNGNSFPLTSFTTRLGLFSTTTISIAVTQPHRCRKVPTFWHSRSRLASSSLPNYPPPQHPTTSNHWPTASSRSHDSSNDATTLTAQRRSATS